MSEIKNWPQFGNEMPYGSWLNISTEGMKFVPLSQPCPVHADGFDCYHFNCTCEEFKFVKRSADEVMEIRTLQREVRDAAILRQAAEIQSRDA